jgi:hypothetical protein
MRDPGHAAVRRDGHSPSRLPGIWSMLLDGAPARFCYALLDLYVNSSLFPNFKVFVIPELNTSGYSISNFDISGIPIRPTQRVRSTGILTLARVPVPEHTRTLTLLLVGIGVLGLVAMRRSRPLPPGRTAPR